MRRYLRGIRVLVSLTPLVLGFLRDRKRWITVGGASTPFRAASWAAGGEVGGPRGQTGADVHQARRINLSIFAMATAVISSIIIISVENVWLLGGGIAIAVLMFVLVFSSRLMCWKVRLATLAGFGLVSVADDKSR